MTNEEQLRQAFEPEIIDDFDFNDSQNPGIVEIVRGDILIGRSPESYKSGGNTDDYHIGYFEKWDNGLAVIKARDTRFRLIGPDHKELEYEIRLLRYRKITSETAQKYKKWILYFGIYEPPLSWVPGNDLFRKPFNPFLGFLILIASMGVGMLFSLILDLALRK